MATQPPGKKISQLDILQSITGDEEVVVSYQGRNYKLTLTEVLAAVNVRIDDALAHMVSTGTINW